MKFNKLPMEGAFIIEPEPIQDKRGSFARIFCTNEYNELGLDSNIKQINNSFNRYKGTMRGIHYQLAPKAETKIIRCIKGTIWDLALDLRINSSTFGKWYGEKLSSDNKKMMYLPKGFGHAFVTLEENTEIIYLTTEFYTPSNERIIRWDDPYFKIIWPIKPEIFSEKDKNAPNFDKEYSLKGGDLT